MERSNLVFAFKIGFVKSADKIRIPACTQRNDIDKYLYNSRRTDFVTRSKYMRINARAPKNVRNKRGQRSNKSKEIDTRI